MLLAWLTDIHLNFLEPPEVAAFLARVRTTVADAILLTGDVSHARDVENRLEEMDEAIGRSFYFILGNIDY